MDMLKELVTIPPFEDLSGETLQLVEPLFEQYACPAGTVIFEQGAPASHLYLLLRGTVTLRYKPYDGPPITLTQITAGGAFGWSAVVGNPHYTSATVAKEDVETLRIRGTELHRLVMEHPEAGKILLDKLAGKVSNRWIDASRQVREILDQAITTRKEKGEKSMATPRDPAKEIQLKALIEQVSAYVEQFHGGSVEYISLNGNLLTVHLGGACLGCPLLPSTLQGWVAGTVHQFFPEVEVTSVE
jgi:CRP-like cAMP-binding protein/Fe-S cluster biogenesis protein NfuA